MQRPRPFTHNASRQLALLCLGLVLAGWVFLPALVALDKAAYSWVQAHRSCTLDQLSAVLKEPLIVLLSLLGLLTLLRLCLQRRWAETWHMALVVALGELFCGVLKDGVERARPSALPPTLVGNSFPSGHVTAAVLIAGTLGFLLARQRWATWVKIWVGAVLLGFVALISWQRLYSGRHWLSDVIGSILLAGAWLCFALPRLPTLARSWRAALLGASLFVYTQAFPFFPHVHLVLPSVMSLSEKPFLDIAFGENARQTRLRGTWGVHSSEPAGPITWARRGEVSVEVELPRRQAYALRLAVRPLVRSQAFACFPLEVAVNQQTVSRLLLYRGWREYTLRLEAAWMVPGTNVITFRTGADFPAASLDHRTVAFRYLRFFPEGESTQSAARDPELTEWKGKDEIGKSGKRRIGGWVDSVSGSSSLRCSASFSMLPLLVW